MTLGDTDYLRPNLPEVLARAIDDHVVLVYTPTGAFFRLNAEAGAVWSMIEAGGSIEQIAAARSAGESARADQVRVDIHRLVERLLHEKLVVLDGSSTCHGVMPAPAVPAGPYSAPQIDAYRLNVHDRLAIRSNDIASKVIDGEAIIINLATGAYYSLPKVGGVIWSMVQAGRTIQQIINGVAESYGVSPWAVRTDLESLAETLTEELLVTVVGCGPMPEAPPLPKATHRYEAPCLEAYRDMEDLLALDPPMPSQVDVAQVLDVPPPGDVTLGDVNWGEPKN